MVRVVSMGRATPKSTRMHTILGYPSHGHNIWYVNGAPSVEQCMPGPFIHSGHLPCTYYMPGMVLTAER